MYREDEERERQLQKEKEEEEKEEKKDPTYRPEQDETDEERDEKKKNEKKRPPPRPEQDDADEEFDPTDPRAGAAGFDSDYSEKERDEEQDIEGEEEPNKHHQPRKFPSCRVFYAARLFERPGEDQWSPILHARRLLEQYIVMSWLKVENTRLDYYRFHQPKLRSLSFNGAMDQVEGDHLEFNDTPEDSRRIILPPSFIYGPRHLTNNYYNTLELAIKEGSPHYFFTVTCNPYWKEIQENLQKKGPHGPGETAYDRLDLVVRVFKLKLDYLIDRLRKGDLGTFIWGTYRVEFQQRGLPHAHIVFRVAQPFAPTNPAIIDRIISACSPDKNTQPNLYKKVHDLMMHTKCGPTASCYDHLKLRCGSGFPKDYCEQTTVFENGRVQYRRPYVPPNMQRDLGVLNNQIVVAHNPYFLLLLGCHGNLEVVQNDGVLKYLFTYINKHSDKVYFLFFPFLPLALSFFSFFLFSRHFHLSLSLPSLPLLLCLLPLPLSPSLFSSLLLPSFPTPPGIRHRRQKREILRTRRNTTLPRGPVHRGLRGSLAPVRVPYRMVLAHSPPPPGARERQAMDILPGGNHSGKHENADEEEYCVDGLDAGERKQPHHTRT
jgi:hypothetical protein